jgi:hypothetical protein
MLQLVVRLYGWSGPALKLLNLTVVGALVVLPDR